MSPGRAKSICIIIYFYPASLFYYLFLISLSLSLSTIVVVIFPFSFTRRWQFIISVYDVYFIPCLFAVLFSSLPLQQLLLLLSRVIRHSSFRHYVLSHHTHLSFSSLVLPDCSLHVAFLSFLFVCFFPLVKSFRCAL